MKAARLFLVIFLALLVDMRAFGDIYPSKPITIVVPWPAGGTVDQRARQIAEKLAKALGQPVVVENRAGASGGIGAGMVAKSAPDGYTLLYGSIADLAINPAINPSPGYDPIQDFAPITQVSSGYFVLAARPGLGAKSLQDLIKLAKSKPGELTCGSSGIGAPMHFSLLVLNRSAHIDISHVPYKGEAPVIADLLGSHIDIGFPVATGGLPYFKAGKLVPLAVLGPRRLSAISEVPTVTELGFPELEMTLWGGFVAPAATSADIIKRLNTELVKIITSAEMREQFANVGAVAVGSTSAEFTVLIQSERARWAKMIKTAGLRME
jgi:tripartite-type tricarboxylate transporter receptor subunit TctC